MLDHVAMPRRAASSAEFPIDFEPMLVEPPQRLHQQDDSVAGSSLVMDASLPIDSKFGHRINGRGLAAEARNEIRRRIVQFGEGKQYEIERTWRSSRLIVIELMAEDGFGNLELIGLDVRCRRRVGA